MIANEAPPKRWRRFFHLAVVATVAPTLVVFLFIATIDPWDALPLSPHLPRLPVTTSARHSFPILARSARVDSAVIGTSTSRLLRPAILDRLFDAHFVNLSIDAATAYEEIRLLDVFVQAHSHPRFILLGLDLNWCDPRPATRYTVYPFPEWLYEPVRWNGYGQLLNLYALQESGKQLWAILGLKPGRYPLDGYSDFRVPEDQYDLARAHEHIISAGIAPAPDSKVPVTEYDFATHPYLKHALDIVPASTYKVLFFVPFVLPYQGADGSMTRAYWDACKSRIAHMAAAVPLSIVIDFMIPSPITREESNYYDAIHYRPAIADRLALDLAGAVSAVTPRNADYQILSP